MPRKRSRPRHPPPSPLEQFFSGLRDTVLDFVEDATYDLQEVLLRQQEAQGQGQVPPLPGPKPKAGKRPRTGQTTVATPTHYDTLQVSPLASTEVIEAAWKSLMKKAHPDVGGSEGRAKRLNQAKDVLVDPVKRREYDRSLWG